MVLDARIRSSLYTKLTPLVGETEANALMSEFPSVEGDELVTKQFLRAELAELRTELAELRGEMHLQTVRLGSALAGATALLVGIGLFS